MMTTKLARISQLSAAAPEKVFHQLMHHFNREMLTHWYHRLKGKAASGLNGVTKQQYGNGLSDHLKKLEKSLKAMSYRPDPVKQVWIPKASQRHAVRSLGISNVEDKIVQKGIQQILEAIYEPLFLDCSYGFRPGRGCHDAIKALRHHLHSQPVKVVMDLDLRNYFGSIDHEILMDFLSKKIQDQRFLRYIRRLLKAGVLSEGELTVSDEGVPQGSICSPILANLFAHHVLDDWFERTVKAHCKGKVALFRYADDAVICCESPIDAQRIKTALIKRLAKYKLSLNTDKTHQVKFDKTDRLTSGAFDFLGFTFYLGLTRRGFVIPKLKSCGKRLRVKLKRVNQWCKANRNRYRFRALWKMFCLKLRGHIQYYGISFNASAIYRFIRQALRVFLKWLNRRSQRRSMNYDQFLQFQMAFPAPKVRLYHRLF